jgi:hypothetical protein
MTATTILSHSEVPLKRYHCLGNQLSNINVGFESKEMRCMTKYLWNDLVILKETPFLGNQLIYINVVMSQRRCAA